MSNKHTGSTFDSFRGGGGRRRGSYLIVGGMLLVLPALLLVSHLDRSRPVEAEGASKTPNPWFWAERAYPLGKIPVERFRMAQEQAATLRARENRGAASWTPRGPENIGGRITDIAVDPTDADTVYAGAAEGGVLRSFDGGQSWTPVFDQMPSLAVGALAIDPNDTHVIYAGTGEVNPGGGSMAYGGTGLYRSIDQGDSWQLVGLESSGSTRPTRSGSSSPPWDCCGTPTPNEGCIAASTGARAGSGCCTSPTTPAAST